MVVIVFTGWTHYTYSFSLSLSLFLSASDSSVITLHTFINMQYACDCVYLRD